MARAFIPLALAALVACAAAASLPTAGRQVVVDDVVGEFSTATFFGQRCPRRIEHTSLPEDGVIPHSTMTQAGQECEDGGEMTIYASAEDAANAVSSDNSKNVIRAVASTGEDAIYAVELNGRRCGSSRLSPQTVVIILRPSKPIFIGVSAFPPNNRIMLVEDPRQEGTCQYRAPLRESPSPNVTPTVTPDDAVTPTPDASPTKTKKPKKTPGVPGGGAGAGSGTGDGDGDDPEPSASPSPDSDGDGNGDGTGTGVNGSPEPQGSPDDDGSVCFPADATVELEDGSVKTMSEVEIGDRVKVANNMYSDVYMFTHKEAATKHTFVRLDTAAGASITATRGHYLYINDRFAAAVSTKVGDVLQLGNGARTTVQRVSLVTKTGLYNPQTVHGDIIVDSVRASTFTRTFEPATAQALLAPFRMMYDVLGWSSSFLDNGADSITQLLPKGHVEL